jgi:F-box/WD-40 domain protein 7
VCGIHAADLGDGHGLIVSAGADRAVTLMDPRKGFEVAHRFEDHRDFIYDIKVAGGICFTGGGDGMLLAHDLRERKLLWGLGANKAAVRAIGHTSNKLVHTQDCCVHIPIYPQHCI